MKFSRILALAATTLLFFTSCGVDKLAGTVGDGDPNKPNVSVGKLDFYAAFESPSGLVTPRNVYVWLPENYSKRARSRTASWSEWPTPSAREARNTSPRMSSTATPPS